MASDRSIEDILAAIRKVLTESPSAPADASPLPMADQPRPRDEPDIPPAPAPSPDAEDLKRRVLIHNEKTKLTATARNTTAVALFGGGFVLPVIGLSFPLAAAPPTGQVTAITMIVWALVAGSLHWWARSMLEGLR
ncbi:hypothetical protein [Methylobacterium sp. Gmos1]